MKDLITWPEFLNESKTSDRIADGITNTINKVDDSLSYTDFAKAVAKIILEDYGKHNIEPFMKELHKELNIK